MKNNKNLSLLLKAVGLVFVLFGAGFIAGRLMNSATKGIEFRDLFKVDAETAGITIAVIQAVIVLSGTISAVILYCKAKKAADNWDGEDEDEIEKIEKDLDRPVIIDSILIIVNTILFSCTCYFLLDDPNAYALIPGAVFLIGLTITIVLNEKCIILAKQLNPEKRGSTFDPKFQKKWLASCDEAQKQMIWHAGFAAFKAGNTACYFMWSITFLLQMLLRFGLMPMICVGVIWLVINVTYSYTAYKLEHFFS